MHQQNLLLAARVNAMEIIWIAILSRVNNDDRPAAAAATAS